VLRGDHERAGKGNLLGRWVTKKKVNEKKIKMKEKRERIFLGIFARLFVCKDPITFADINFFNNINLYIYRINK
jgi:hypothetical protein